MFAFPQRNINEGIDRVLAIACAIALCLLRKAHLVQERFEEYSSQHRTKNQTRFYLFQSVRGAQGEGAGLGG